MSISCPKRGVEVSSPPERECRFQQYRVSRFRCERGDKFNLYSGASKTFTIPRRNLTSGIDAEIVRLTIRLKPFSARIVESSFSRASSYQPRSGLGSRGLEFTRARLCPTE